MEGSGAPRRVADMMMQLEIDGVVSKVQIERGKSPFQYSASINGEPAVEIEAHLLRPGILSLHIAGKAYRCVLEEGLDGPAVHVAGERVAYRVDDPRSLKSRRGRHGGTDGPKTLTAPMPGRVVRVLAEVGDAVEAHQGIVVIEAMKMQNELKSPKAGRLVTLRVVPGSTVAAGEALAVVE
jgi:biotin carboxyl carrier protein